MATEGKWITVSRRRSTNGNLHRTPPQTKPYKPYQATYADVVRRNSTSPPNPDKPTTKPSTTSSSKPNTPQKPRKPFFYISPHSPSQLRFPPSPSYTEWKGRCFRCCRMGHNAAHCRNQKRCGKCWGQGHIGAKCEQVTPYWPTVGLRKEGIQCEPKFADLLVESIVSKPLTEDRPPKTVCYVDRDEEYYDEMSRLKQAVIMYNPTLEFDLSIEQVAEFAAKSGLVKPDEISIGIMTKSRYVIRLPHGIDPDKFIKAIPVDVWKEGYSFYQWSPLDDSSKMIPHFKVLLDLVGIPLDLYRLKEVIRATSAFGTYLGTVEQPTPGDVACWSVAVATTDLAQIPHQMEFRVGGRKTLVDVILKNWIHTPLYKDEELEQIKTRFKPLFPADEPSPTSSQDNNFNDDEFMGSRRVLEELCKGRDMESLPAGVRQVLGGARSMVVTQTQHEVTTDNHMQITQLSTHTQDTGNLYEDPILEANLVVIQGSPSVHKTSHTNTNTDSLQEEEARSPTQTVTPVIRCYQKHEPASLNKQLSSLNMGCGANATKECSVNPPRILVRGKDKIPDEMAGAIIPHPFTSPTKTPAVKVFSPRVLRTSTRQKRKIAEQTREIKAQGKNSKKSSKAQETNSKQAKIIPNDDGLFEVQVNFEHCSRIAAVSGFQTAQVVQALAQDNEERRKLASNSTVLEGDLDLGEHLTDFDPDSDDELDSDFE